jgi:hypothetical protein
MRPPLPSSHADLVIESQQEVARKAVEGLDPNSRLAKALEQFKHLPVLPPGMEGLERLFQEVMEACEEPRQFVEEATSDQQRAERLAFVRRAIRAQMLKAYLLQVRVCARVCVGVRFGL